jgi:transcriptional regulator with XRE-family HTH domain
LSRSRRVFSLCFFCARLRLFTFDRTAARCFCVAMDRLYPAESVRITCEHMFALTYPDYIRLKARELRTERNMSIDEIAERLALSRTTVFYWLRDLPIKRSERPRTLAQLNGSIAMQAKYRLLREAAYAVGRTTFDDLAWDPSFRDFLCLYVAEGTKRDRNRVEVCNSDLAVITVCHEWMCRLSCRPPSYAIQYHADQDFDALRLYWSTGLGIPPDQIRLLRKSNSNHLTGRTWRSRYGVLTVTVHDTLLRAKLDGWMDRLRESWL